MKRRWPLLVIPLLLVCAFIGWFLYNTPDFLGNLVHADAAIQTGSYWRIQHSYAKPTPVAVTVISLDIDREKGLAVFHMQDGSKVQAALAGPEEVQWGEGCNTMSGSTRMEFLPLAEDRLVLGDTTFVNPYLAGTCPAPPLTIVLGEGKKDREGISDAAACDWYNGAKCVYFGQEYVNLHVQVCDRESGEPLTEANLTLETPRGNQVFPNSFQVRLSGNARYPITVTAPGYATYEGTIQVDPNVVMIWNVPVEGEPEQASVLEEIVNTEEVNVTIYLNK